MSCAYDPPSRLGNALAGGKRSRTDTVAICNVCSSGGLARARRARLASQDVAAIPSPGAVIVAGHPARESALGALVPPIVPLVGIETAIAVEVAIIVVAAVVCQRRRRHA